eukprot:TRINITY_DN30237_c0_g1_i1.p1 TRINITY_DN30237_c0_g1~~TRINITY_DN30237_c0_g1_i1.p1  ORF type:complete len:631 (+),score=231.90 TRINITY_DN30237_c0_g1_i1:106-1893(+)
MLLNEEDFVAAYATIRERWTSGGQVPVQCLVGADVDAVCTLKVLMQLLLADKIKPVVTPVHNIADFRAALSELPEGEVTVVLVNCGAALPLDDLMPEGDIAVHMFDTHRPVHFDNILSKSVRVWQTGDVASYVKKCHETRKKRRGRGRGGSPSRKRIRTERGESISLSSSSSASDEDDEDSDAGARDAAELELFDKRYYRGNWFGTPSCAVLHQLASLVIPNPPDDLVWFASVATTHHFLAGRMARATYEAVIAEFLLEIARRNLSKPSVERLREDSIEYKAYHAIRLDKADDMHLYLLRHSSLWESIVASPYLASRLQLHNSDQGRERILSLIHGSLGLSEAECKVEWHLWNRASEKKDKLQKLANLLRPLGMSDFTFAGVEMFTAYEQGVTASDFAQVVGWVLTYPTANGGSEGFWNAFDLLDNRRKKDQLKEAAQIARSAQAALLRQTAALLQKEYIRDLYCFRYAFVNEVCYDAKFFVHPLTLTLLARSVLDSLVEDAKKSPSARPQTPLLLLALDKATELYSVAYVVPQAGKQGAEHHTFGASVIAAANAAGIPSNQVGFDPSAGFRIPKRDVRSLLDSLTLSLHKQTMG